MSRSTSRRVFLYGCAVAALRAGAEESDARKTPETPGTPDPRIQRLEAFYARVYGEPLSTTERLPREIAIVSLSRIDAAETTDRLIGALRLKDRDPVIQYLAWEALHARHVSLTAEQRELWIAAGVKAANAGAFPGASVTPMLRVLASHEPTRFEAEPAQLAVRVVRENAIEDQPQRLALDALRDLIATWRELRMIRLLIAQAAKKPVSSRLNERIDYVLRGLPSPPPAGAKWTIERVNKLKPASAAELKPYAGKAIVFPAPAKITDPNDPRWRAELEITKLAVSDFDLAWCIDSTGSMNEENQLVAKETGLVMRVCGLVSKRARCGTIYFRHETDPALMQPCCKAVKSNPAWYAVKLYPLTDQSAPLAATMAKESIPRPAAKVEGNVHPGGAFHAALSAAMNNMPWSKDPLARRAIVLVGDSRMTPGSESACAKLTADAKSKGFQVHALVKDGAVRTWPAAIETGGGVLLPFRTDDDLARLPENVLPRRRELLKETLAPDAVFRKVAATIIRASVTPPYHDRVDPLVSILLDYAKASQSAEQALAELAMKG